MKNKETLEEAVKRLFSKYSNNTSLSEGHYDYLMDEEDFKDASTELVKWQQERMYSEEEVYDILVQHTIELFKGQPCTLDEFFEQFKKK